MQSVIGHRPLRVKFILPALTEATSPFWRPIKYSLFPPLGLATLAAYLDRGDAASIVDEHVEPLRLDDAPDLVVIPVYITNAYRAYRIADHYRARGSVVALGGLHVTSLPEEAAAHADAIFLGPGEQTFPCFLADLRHGRARKLYRSAEGRTIEEVPPIRRDLIEHAAEAGLRSLFVGFETLTPENLRRSRKHQNLGRNYAAVAARLHGLGIMINGSFVFGMDDDDDDVFARTVDWAVANGITTATFHIQTPYPGTALFSRMDREGRIATTNWDLYDTRHVVFRPARLSPAALEEGYHRAYETFYRWSAIAAASFTHGTLKHQLKHFAYAAGWKKFEPLWDLVIRARQLGVMTPLLEAVLSKVSGRVETAEGTAASPEPAFELPLYSARSATTGSTFSARRDGT